jgi:hypothetical protein
MREDLILSIFQRDMASINVGHHPYSYVVKMCEYAVEFYSAERGLPPGHHGRIFSDDEYQLLIDLYKNELHQLQQA